LASVVCQFAARSLILFPVITKPTPKHLISLINQSSARFSYNFSQAVDLTAKS